MIFITLRKAVFQNTNQHSRRKFQNLSKSQEGIFFQRNIYFSLTETSNSEIKTL